MEETAEQPVVPPMGSEAADDAPLPGAVMDMPQSMTQSKSGMSKAPQETGMEYDSRRLAFMVLLGIMSACGLLSIVLMIAHHSKFAAAAKPKPLATYSWSKSSSNLHILFMILFGVLAQGYAILMYRILPATMDRFKVKLVHFGLNLLVALGMILGVATMWCTKDTANKKNKHIKSFHSWIGIGAVVLFLLQLVGGTALFLLPATPIRTRAALLPFHQAAGLIIFTLTGFAGMAGYMHKSSPAFNMMPMKPFEITDSELMAHFSGVFFALFMVIGIYLVSANQFRRRPRP